MFLGSFFLFKIIKGENMYKYLLAIICLSIVFTSGCASLSMHEVSSRIDNLDRRLTKVEEGKISSTGNSSAAQRVETFEVKPSPTKDVSRPISMTAKEVQTALKNAGYYSGSIDGKIGPKTKEAIKAFQSENGLKVDGVVGSNTQRLLAEYLLK